MLQRVLLTLWLFAVYVHCGRNPNYTVTEEVFFDIEIKDFDGPGEDYRGRFVVGLFGDTAPMTCMNFAAIARGYKRGREKLHYKNSYVHKIIRDFIIQLGDIVVGDGSGSRSIYGEKFIDENFILSHRSTGFVSMANQGKDTNGSQFFVMLNRARWLDGNHVVFGKVVQGMGVVKTIGDVPTAKGTNEPKNRIKIVDSGVIGIKAKYELTEEQTMSDEDIEREEEDED